MTRETRTKSHLQLEQRVPEGYSAVAAEHAWHNVPYVSTAVADALNGSQVFEMAAVMLGAAKPRNDYEYRVVLITVETTRQSVQP